MLVDRRLRSKGELAFPLPPSTSLFPPFLHKLSSLLNLCHLPTSIANSAVPPLNLPSYSYASCSLSKHIGPYIHFPSTSQSFAIAALTFPLLPLSNLILIFAMPYLQLLLHLLSIHSVPSHSTLYGWYLSTSRKILAIPVSAQSCA